MPDAKRFCGKQKRLTTQAEQEQDGWYVETKRREKQSDERKITEQTTEKLRNGKRLE